MDLQAANHNEMGQVGKIYACANARVRLQKQKASVGREHSVETPCSKWQNQVPRTSAGNLEEPQFDGRAKHPT
jgi:hypothetical protein